MSLSTALFIFHRDLRLVDNTALDIACTTCDIVYPVFIFPNDQIQRQNNAYFSDAAVQFMCESLSSLDAEIMRKVNKGGHRQHLTLLRGESTARVVKQILTDVDSITHIIFNSDESPYAKARDDEIANVCSSSSFHNKRRQVTYISVPNDAYIVGLNDALYHDDKADVHRPYTNFSQFYARLMPFVSSISHKVNNRTNLSKLTTLPSLRSGKSNVTVINDQAVLAKLYEPLHAPAERGGRANGLKALNRARGMLDMYTKTRDVMSNNTTRLSPHLRFGTVSIREAYAAAAGCDSLQRQLAFREFYRKAFVTNDMALMRRPFRPFHKDIDAKIPWRQPKDDPNAWEAWTQGRSGFPLVDAGIHELLNTGFMHNRARMVVASFATRYLLFDWRTCAQFFYTKLCDADPINNTAGWQWAAGVGIDSPPSFRRPLNPFRQSAKYDKDAVYIKMHLKSELHDITPRDLHRWNDDRVRSQYKHLTYPPPILDVQEASNRALEIWRRASKKT